MGKFLITLIALSMIGCASKELPLKATSLNSTEAYKLNISAEIVEEYSDPYNVLLQINMENTGGNWARIDEAALDLSNVDGLPYNIIVGNDLRDWAKAKADLISYKEQNQNMALLGANAAGAALFIAGALSKNDGLTMAGATIYGASVVAGISNELEAQKNSVHRTRIVPESHLYSQYSVPSMGLVKKWILVNVPKGRIAKFGTLKLKTIEGEELNYQLPIIN